MARLAGAVLCQRVLVDKDTNQVSYIDVLEALAARSLPSELPRVYVATLWAQDEEGEELRVRFRLLPPGSSRPITEFITEPITLRTRHRINLDLQGAPVTTEGEYTVAVDHFNGNRFRNSARLPLLISLQNDKKAR